MFHLKLKERAEEALKSMSALRDINDFTLLMMTENQMTMELHEEYKYLNAQLKHHCEQTEFFIRDLRSFENMPTYGTVDLWEDRNSALAQERFLILALQNSLTDKLNAALTKK